MKKIVIPGGIYADALLDSSTYVASVGNVLVTDKTQISLPPGVGPMMFNRLALDGRIASKEHSIGHAWIYDGSWHDTEQDSAGSQGHGWNPDGSLAVISGAQNQESQGLRFFDPTLPSSLANLDVLSRTPGWVTGSPSYGDKTPLAQHVGVTRLAAWTKLGDIAVGQGYNDEGGAVIQYQNQHRLLEPGDTQFIQFRRAGSQLVVAISKLREKEVVIIWMDESEINSLPLYPNPTTPTEPKPEEPKPEEPQVPTVTIPNHFAVVEQVAAEHSELLEQNNSETCKEFYWRSVWALHQVDPNFGFLSKSEAENHITIGDHLTSVDAVAYKGSDEVVDIMQKAGDGPGTGGAMWGLDERKPSNVWIKPIPFPEAETPTEEEPKPEEKPTPEEPKPKEPPVSEPDYEGLLALIVAKVVEELNKSLAETVKELRGDIADLRKELDTLTFEAKHRLLGTITFTRKK